MANDKLVEAVASAVDPMGIRPAWSKTLAEKALTALAAALREDDGAVEAMAARIAEVELATVQLRHRGAAKSAMVGLLNYLEKED